MPLALLKQIEDSLTALGAPPNDFKQLNAAISAVWDAYRKTTQAKNKPSKP
jgi:hypothetical protein